MTREEALKEMENANAVFGALCAGDMEWMDIPGPARKANDEALIEAKARFNAAHILLEQLPIPEGEPE